MKTLTEKEAEDFLEKEGFKVVKRILIKNKDELKKIENKIDFPWVMKISSRHVVHKAKIGGTILNIKNLEEAGKAFAKLKSLNHFEGILVQEMIFGEELILGIEKTSEFENVIMFGKGGTDVEKVKDVSFRLPPVCKEEAGKMLKELRTYKKLRSRINEKEIIKNIIKASQFAEKHKEITELDINPLIANKKQVMVVDARISIKTNSS